MKSCEMDYMLNRESEKFGRVDETFKGHIYSVNMRANTLEARHPQQEIYKYYDLML